MFVKRINGLCWFLTGACLWLQTASASAARSFAFEHDTFAFSNETILEYHDGHASLRPSNSSETRARRFTQHCFVMSRSVVQFRKFARFDPTQRPLDNRELAVRIRRITRKPPWSPPLPERDRILLPGYPDLRTLTRLRTKIVQENIGLGWTTYFRPGNWRILLPHGRAQQAKTHQALERRLARGEFFIAYLTTFPESLSINHGVLVYERKQTTANGHASRTLGYNVYDPNHAEAPRRLNWSPRDGCFLYQRDWDFVGGPVTVWEVYGRPLQ